jgi:dephospho-CoA kinase
VKRLVVGLAGGIGSGKSTVAALFRKWGARIVDADAIAHRVLQRRAVCRRLVREWGSGILRRGRPDRAALARKAFASKASAERLNRIVHPLIRREVRRRIAALRGVVIYDAALLFEAGAHRRCDCVVFVHAPRRLRRRRTAARGWPPGEWKRREALQWPLANKRRRADFTVDNSGTKKHTERQTGRIYKTLLRRLNISPV